VQDAQAHAHGLAGGHRGVVGQQFDLGVLGGLQGRRRREEGHDEDGGQQGAENGNQHRVNLRSSVAKEG